MGAFGPGGGTVGGQLRIDFLTQRKGFVKFGDDEINSGFLGSGGGSRNVSGESILKVGQTGGGDLDLGGGD